MIRPHGRDTRGPETILCARCGHRLAHARNNIVVSVTEPDYRADAMITIQCSVCDVLNQIRFIGSWTRKPRPVCRPAGAHQKKRRGELIWP